MPHNFLRYTGEFAFPVPADIGVSTTTTTGLLGFLTKATTADVAWAAAGTVDGPSVAQGTAGTWFVTGSVTVTVGANANVNFKLNDGTNTYGSGQSATVNS